MTEADFTISHRRHDANSIPAHGTRDDPDSGWPGAVSHLAGRRQPVASVPSLARPPYLWRNRYPVFQTIVMCLAMPDSARAFVSAQRCACRWSAHDRRVVAPHRLEEPGTRSPAPAAAPVRVAARTPWAIAPPAAVLPHHARHRLDLDVTEPRRVGRHALGRAEVDARRSTASTRATRLEHAERLRHVVVGAQRNPLTLSASSPRAVRISTGTATHPRGPREDAVTIHPRKHQIEDLKIGRHGSRFAAAPKDRRSRRSPRTRRSRDCCGARTRGPRCPRRSGYASLQQRCACDRAELMRCVKSIRWYRLRLSRTAASTGTSRHHPAHRGPTRYRSEPGRARARPRARSRSRNPRLDGAVQSAEWLPDPRLVARGDHHILIIVDSHARPSGSDARPGGDRLTAGPYFTALSRRLSSTCLSASRSASATGATVYASAR